MAELDGSESDTVVEFFEPAQFWPEALPLGSGRLGAMLYGGVQSELVQLNEDTLWSGGPSDWNNPNAQEILPQVRELVRGGKYAEATLLSKEMLGPNPQVYQPLGDLKLDFGEAHNAYDTESYHRQLDLDTAMTYVNYTVDDTTYLRQAFASYPHQVVAMRVAGSNMGSVSFSITLDSQLLQETQVFGHNRIILKGQCPGDGNKTEATKDETLREKVSQGMSFVAVLEVQVFGGTSRLEVLNDQTLKVHEADSAVLYIAASSSYDGPFKDPSNTNRVPRALALQTLESIKDLSFDELLAAHLADYQPLFQRVSLRLGNNRRIREEGEDTTVEEEMFSERKHGRDNITQRGVMSDNIREGNKDLGSWEFIIPLEIMENRNVDEESEMEGGDAQVKHKKRVSTRDRVLNFKENEDPALVVLLFQYGRYLLIASSRPGTFVSNLQGVWNNELHPAWRCCPTLNINLEMNYWPVETCNLAECHLPLFDFLEELADTGATTAKVNYGSGGWVSHHNADIWAQSAPVGGDPVWALWPMSGAWINLHLWEHYTFSQDEEFLRHRAFPLFKGCAEFFLTWLVEDDKGHLVTNPSTSPEHDFIAPDGQTASVSYGTTMDMAILHNFFSAMIAAAKVLGMAETDLVRKVKTALDRLLPPKIGSDGRLMEWVEDFKDTEEHHRHMSHLFGLYPGHSLTIQTTPDLCEAGAQSMIKRGEVGPGWSMAWKTALWARLGDDHHAYSMVKRMFTLIAPTEKQERFDGGGVYANLFNAHPPFQIDGNLGFTAAIAEMLFQSDEQNLYLLPALPAQKWRDGLVAGLRGRGAVTLGIRWFGGHLDEVTIQYGVNCHSFGASLYHGDECEEKMCQKLNKVDKNFSATRKLYYKQKVVELPKASSGPQLYTYDGNLNLMRSRNLEDPYEPSSSCVIL